MSGQSEMAMYIAGMPYVNTGYNPQLPPTIGNVSSVGVAPRTVLESVATPAEDRQLMVAGDRAIVPLVYGITRLGAKLVTAIDYQGDLVMLLVWAFGPVEAIDQIYIGNDPVPAGITMTTYLGSWTDTGGGVNALLVSAFAAKGLTYGDNLWQIAYSVARIPPNVVEGVPQFSARIKGRKVYDYRDGTQSPTTPSTWKWSDNPVLCLTDFLYYSVAVSGGGGYGLGVGFDTTSATTAADACDTDLGGKKKRTLNLALDVQADGKTWLAALRTYAGVWVADNGNNGVNVRVETTGTSVKSYDSSNIVSGTMRLSKRSNRNAPNVVEIIYTDTTVIPYRDGTATSPQFGTGQLRLSQVRLPGINNHEQAYREAIERVNDLNLNDLEGSFMAFDDGFMSEMCDIIDVTDPIGLSAKLVRVTKATPADAGRFRISFKEYDPAKYSSVVASGPSYVDTNLPTAAVVTAPTGLTLLEELYQTEAYGGYASRLKITWASPSYPLIDHYHIDVLDGSNVVWTGDVPPLTLQYYTGALREGVLYTVNVYTATAFGTKSTALSSTITAQGKLIPPGNVPAIRAFEAGGKVFISIDPAVDIDISRYEYRYGLTNSWASGILIDRVDALTYVAQTVPPGSWYIMVKAIDSVGNYSASAASVIVTVTLDNNAFLVTTLTSNSPEITSMAQWSQRVEPQYRFDLTWLPSWYYTSEFGDGFGYGADNTNNGTGTFNDSLVNVSLASPHSTGTSTSTSQYMSETWDLETALAGTWTVNANITDHVGTSTTVVEASLVSGTGPWTTVTGTSALLNGRYVRFRTFSTGAFTIKDRPTVQLSVVPRRETGTVTTTGTGYVRVTLANRYMYARSIQVTPVGTAARLAVVDNVIVGTGSANTFDVYAFTDAGVQVAVPVYYTFEGASS